MQTVPRHLHPSFVVLPPPIRVSPLIRFARWSALGVGIVWGYIRLRQISRYHADIRDWEQEKAIAAHHEHAKIKKMNDRAEMITIMELANMPFEEGVKQLGCADMFKFEMNIVDELKKKHGIVDPATVAAANTTVVVKDAKKH